jgi:hypothetical protein
MADLDDHDEKHVVGDRLDDPVVSGAHAVEAVLASELLDGSVHDFTNPVIAMREGGKSIAEVARKTLGRTGFNLIIAFTILMIVLLTSPFLAATLV